MFRSHDMKKYTIQSLIGHIGIVLFCFLFTFVGSKIFKSNKKNFTFIQSSVRVDVVAMPKISLKRLKAIQTLKSSNSDVGGIEEETPVEDKNTNDKTFLKEKKKKNFSDLLNRLSKRKVKKDKKINKKKGKGSGNKKSSGTLSNSARNELRDLVLAGNKLSKGSAIVGSSGAAVAGIVGEYLGSLPDHVRPNWKLPSFLIDKELTCRIRIFLSKTGKLLKAEVFESSGNDTYDQRALNAVRSSSPYPNLPEEVISKAINGEIVLGFPL